MDLSSDTESHLEKRRRGNDGAVAHAMVVEIWKRQTIERGIPGRERVRSCATEQRMRCAAQSVRAHVGGFVPEAFTAPRMAGEGHAGARLFPEGRPVHVEAGRV